MSAMLIFLTIVCILIVIFIFIGNVYILAYFSHPEDQITEGIWYYRGLVILSLSFACYIIFAIPLDISSANRADSIGLGYPMDFIWALINFVICLAVMFLLPFALSVYTNFETEFKRKVKFALKTAGVVLGFHMVLCIVYKIMCGKA